MNRTALSDTLLAALDPSQLMRRVGMQPDPWQIRALLSRALRQLWLCARQTGKSTTAAVLALHETLFAVNRLALLISPSLRQSGELFKRAITLYRLLGETVPPDAETQLSLTLKNGSRIVSLPGGESTLRGYSPHLVVLDEAARIEDDTFVATRPMVATTGGRIIAMSTPAGHRGWFSGEWHEGEAWERTRITARECPRISEAFLDAERRSMGMWQFSQEYECEFVEAASQAFPGALIDQAFDPSVTPLW